MAKKRNEPQHVSGKVGTIVTNRDGTTEVAVLPGEGADTEFFDHPGELTSAQLKELKRAQSHDLPVVVTWTVRKNGAKKVTSVQVMCR